MKRKEETERKAKPADAAKPEAATTPPETGNGEPVDSLVDIGPEVEPETDEAAAAAAPEPTPEQKEAAKLADRLLRLQADFDNFRKRTNRDREELQKRAGAAVLADLIPILDNLEFGLTQALAKTGGESFVDGLKLIQTQLIDVVRKHGIEMIDAVGKVFDPHEHEALAYAPSNDVPEGTVLAQSRRGYRLGDRLLRAAMVVVSSGPAQAGHGQTGEG
jgi:molecular chaperone GrpE